MGIWQIIYIVIVSLGLGVVASKHGERNTIRHNFWVSITVTVITIFILYMGGFFG